MELPSSPSVVAARNYLTQARCAKGVAIPAARGVTFVNTANPVPPFAELEACEDGVTIHAIACSPAPMTLLALVTSAEPSTVQVWTVGKAGGTAASGASHSLTLPNAGACRQLHWHPFRRVLVAVLPDRAVLFQLPTVGTQGGACIAHELARPDASTGAFGSCCWSASGEALAAACERAVVVFRWTLFGAQWASYTCTSFPIAGRRLCALASLVLARLGDEDEGDEDGDAPDASDAFVLGLGVPIASGAGADISCNAPPRKISSSAHSAGSVTSSAAATGDEPMLDLRGRIGGGDARTSVLDLHEELLSLRPSPPPSLQQELASPGCHGALQICGGAPSAMVQLSESVDIDVPQPDLLACDCELLVAAGSAMGRIYVLSHRPADEGQASPSHPAPTRALGTTTARVIQPLRTLSLPDGYRTRGLVFDSTSRQLLALGGQRQQASVVFSSPAAQQKLVLCAFGDAGLRNSCPAPSAAEQTSPAARHTEPPQADASVPDQQTELAWRAGLSALQAHVDARFDRIEKMIEAINQRLGLAED